MSNWHVSHVPRGSPAHSRRNFPGCCGSSASDTVWSSKSQFEQSCGLERQMKKKALLRNKKPGFHMWHRGNTKITNLTWQPYFFTIYHFDVAYFNRTVHVYRALIGRPPICKIWKKKLRTGREFVDTWHAQLQTWRVIYITSICDHRTKIFKKVETKFHVLRSNILQQKQNWPISDWCSMLNLRDSEIEAPNPWLFEAGNFEKNWKRLS
jgi:hypothetical protein